MTIHYTKCLICLGLLYADFALPDSKAQQILSQLHLPKGFNISLYADNVPNARTLALGDKGVVYVGTRQQGSVYALQDINQDGISDQRYLLGSDLNMPNGVAYKDGALYVAEINRIIRFDNITTQLAHPPKPTIIYDQLPKEEWHGWKVLRFGTDNKLYTAVGAPCNVCIPKQAIHGSLVRLNADGSDFEILAQGIRNSVGFDWQPSTGQLFFTDNGRDNLGDDLPPDELNHWSSKGQHFGFPYCHAGEIVDPDIADTKSCAQFVAPVWTFKAHMAPLGMRFYTGTQFPAHYKNQLFVAQHGSWNRTKPQGYRVVSLTFKAGKPISEAVFIDGWLTDKSEILGRPTDILQLPDGSLLIADDTLGVIYKVTYQGN
ncbi:MAG: sorbosone dehydrogenase family protein [Methylococcaceae bacterium]|nr:sorbosone dehydrogenase family protein [Methylococcaceae bacterium]